MSSGERILSQRKRMGLSQQGLADRAEVSLHTVFRAEKGHNVQLDSLQKISRALGVSLEYLTEEVRSDGLDSKQYKYIAPSESNVQQIPGSIVEVPVYSFSACMGGGFDNEGEICTTIDTLYLSRNNVGVAAPEKPFALLVEGNSMSPTIEDGERIVVNPNILPGRGDVCLARIKTRGYLRDAVKFYFPRLDGGCILRSSETSGIPPLEFTVEEVKENDVVIVGRVVYIDTGRKI